MLAKDDYLLTDNHQVCLLGSYEGSSETLQQPAIVMYKLFDEDTGSIETSFFYSLDFSKDAVQETEETEAITENAVENNSEDVSTEFKNALKSAETYASIMHMSKNKVYDQLTSEDGEKFPADAAQYAVDNLNAYCEANRPGLRSKTAAFRF